MSSEEIHLSTVGVARRDAILRDAIGAARSRRVSRQRRTALVGITTVAIIALLAWQLRPHVSKSIPEHLEVSNQHPTPVVSKAKKPVMVTLITTNAHSLERYSRPAVNNCVQVLNDDQFLTAMREAGHPVGLAYVNGEAKVLPH